MKKFYFTLCVCLYALLSVLSASPTFAADPFDVHEGGFGPKIKGIQLGMPMTLMGLLDVGVKFGTQSTFHIVIKDIGQKGDLALIFEKDDTRLTNWWAIDEKGDLKSDETAVKEFSQYKTFRDLFEAVSKEGFSTASFEDVRFDDRAFFNVCRINSKNRVKEFWFTKGFFTDNLIMPHKEFAQALSDTYNLPDLQGELEDGITRYSGINEDEGWCVIISSHFIGYIQVFAIPIDDALLSLKKAQQMIEQHRQKTQEIIKEHQ